MEIPFEHLLLTCEVIIFISIILMNLVKKNADLVTLYVIESLALVGMLAGDGVREGGGELIIVTLIVLIIKVIFAPYFFYRFLRHSRLSILTSTYLNVPFTLTLLLTVIFFANSALVEPLKNILMKEDPLPMMLVSSIIMSIVILINRKGTLSQIIGILSLENTVVAFGFFLGQTQTLLIEIGILFNIVVWIVIATVFIELVYQQLGSVEVTGLNKLKK